MSRLKINNILKSSGLLTMAAFYVASPLFAPGLIANVSAQSCNDNFQGGGAGIVSNFVKAPAIDSTASSLAYEITPSGAPIRSTDNIFSGANLSKSDCTSSVYLTGNIIATEITVGFSDGSRTGAFVSGTDYTNLAVGAAASANLNTYFSAKLTLPAVSANTPITVKYDLVSAGAGWARYSYQIGSAAAVTVVDMKLPATDMIFTNTNNSGRH